MKTFFTGFLQVFFVVLNTWLITQKNYYGVFTVGFMISFIWSYNVRKVVFGDMKTRILYSLGAATGGTTGLLIGQLF